MIGLSLSGGGVRSATFNLGMLQALAAAGKLKAFDYLSTVSGGGYVGGWWSAWLSRKERDSEPGRIFPPPEDIESERDDRRAQMEKEGSRADVDRPQIKDSAINAATDPIHHLRLFSNVMTPRKGILSGDTWRAIASITRNILLTWLILLPILLAAIIIGQAWFTLGGEPADLVVTPRQSAGRSRPALHRQSRVHRLLDALLQAMADHRRQVGGDDEHPRVSVIDGLPPDHPRRPQASATFRRRSMSRSASGSFTCPQG